jgi:glycine cleavage system H protein
MYFTPEHEWLSEADGVVTVGITDFAQSELGEIVFVELPEVGREVRAGDTIASVESVKSVSDVFAPVTGTITEVNSSVVDDPASVNTDPEGGAWFFKIRLAAPAELETLLDAETYQALIA